MLVSKALINQLEVYIQWPQSITNIADINIGGQESSASWLKDCAAFVWIHVIFVYYIQSTVVVLL